MSIIPKLATSLNRRDEVPNQVLAAEILASRDDKAINELVENLLSKNKGIRHDCVKALYEIGYVDPKLISAHLNSFLDLLESKDNRMQWGAMIAIGCIAKERPDSVFAQLSRILDAAAKGSVITRDHCVRILATLAGLPKYSGRAFPLLAEQLIASPPNQFAMYAELAAPTVDGKNRERFVSVLESRLGDLEKESQRKRIAKVTAKIKRA